MKVKLLFLLLFIPTMFAAVNIGSEPTVVQSKGFSRDTLFSTLVGGLLAVLGGFAANWYSHKLEKKHQISEQKQFQTNVLLAIRRELEALSEIFEQGTGDLLNQLPEGQPYMMHFRVSQDYFVVFESNAAHMGQIPAEVSRSIVRVYTLMKHLIEELRINNEYVERHERIEVQVASVGSSKEEFSSINKLLLGQVVKIRQVRQRLRAEYDQLMSMLDAKGIS